jgi:DNA-binding response OmpR family regulator
MEEPRARVVCVDDDRDTCEMVRAVLNSSGYDVLTATTVREGLSLIRNNGCDLILLDGRLPDGTGVEMCRAIRAFDPETPILFCSGADDRSDIERAMCAGAQGYLVKPYGLRRLKQSIAGLLVKECHPL